MAEGRAATPSETTKRSTSLVSQGGDLHSHHLTLPLGSQEGLATTLLALAKLSLPLCWLLLTRNHTTGQMKDLPREIQPETHL